MAINSLRTLVSQVPNWQKRLDQLVADIKARQNELAAAEESSQSSAPAPDEPPATPGGPTTPPSAPVQPADRMNLDSATASALSKQPTTASGGNTVASGGQAKPDPVYFDGSMQKYFEELVHFIAVSRNMMRKAKMAARVAQIKKMAEMEIQDELGDPNSDGPTLRYVSPRRIDMGGGPNGSRLGRGSDVFDTLDKNLDTLQSTSELAAFQFLREASNNRHVKSINKILEGVLETATAELARLEQENLTRDPDAGRTKRPLSMRKELPAGAKVADGPNKRQNTGELDPSTSLPSIGHMEVDFDALRNEAPIEPQIIHLPTNLTAQ